MCLLYKCDLSSPRHISWPELCSDHSDQCDHSCERSGGWWCDTPWSPATWGWVVTIRGQVTPGLPQSPWRNSQHRMWSTHSHTLWSPGKDNRHMRCQVIKEMLMFVCSPPWLWSTCQHKMWSTHPHILWSPGEDNRHMIGEVIRKRCWCFSAHLCDCGALVNIRCRAHILIFCFHLKRTNTNI